MGNSITWLLHKLISTTLGDITVLIAFWPTKKVHSPLLKDADMDFLDTEEPRRRVTSSFLSEDGVSMVEDDRSAGDVSPARA